MAPALPPPHFVLVPLLLQGHTIPMVDLGFLFAERGARVSIVTTTATNAAAQLQEGIVADRARRRANKLLLVEIVELPFPGPGPGLPPAARPCRSGSEKVDDFLPLLQALHMLAGPLEAYLRGLARRPSCIINDSLCSWTVGVARRVGVPRLSFQAASCFFALCALNVHSHSGGGGGGDHGYVVPGMPVRVEMSEDTWSSSFLTTPVWEAFLEEAREGVRAADGVVANTFLELEGEFVEGYEAALGKPVWALGPSSCLGNQTQTQMQGDDDQLIIMAWLDAMDDSAVTYVSFGSLVRMLPSQLYEVGHGLEQSGKPFLWVVKDDDKAETEEWLQALEARTAGRGLVARGWAPQLAILSHRAVGGFLTHCGWNSLVESVTLGVPLLTWPHFADHFLNEQLAVQVLGVAVPVCRRRRRRHDVVRAEDIARAVSELMGGGEVAQDRRAKCKHYAEKAHRAIQQGGSSYENMTQLLHTFTPSSANSQQH